MVITGLKRGVMRQGGSRKMDKREVWDRGEHSGDMDHWRR